MRLLLALVVLAVVHTAAAQSTSLPDDDPKLQFEVVSIKKNDGSSPGGSGRTSPDGTTIMVNQPIREKFAGHMEEREQQTFALVVARPDGKPGPELKPSTLDCGPRTPSRPPPPPRATAPTFDEMRGTCGMMMGSGRIVSGGMTLDNLAQSFGNMPGGFVVNKTGLTGFYSLSLTYAEPGNRPPGAGAADPADAPELSTAVQEQLGLKLVPERTKVPVLVVDHIEPPTAN